jgi:hypothetical protein
METLKAVIGGGLLALCLFLTFVVAEKREENRHELEKKNWIEQGFEISE